MAAKSVSKSILKFVAKTILFLAVFFVFLTSVIGLYVFAVPSVKLNSELTASLVERYAPDNLKIGFKSFTLEFNRPPGQFFSKKIVLETQNLCVKFEKTAVDTCLGDVHLALTAGFNHPHPGESRFMPHLMSIEPIFIRGAVVHIDLTAFPASKSEQSGGFDFVGFVRKEVLPKWDVEGSRIEVKDFLIRTAPSSSFAARFDLQPGDGNHVIDAILHEVKEVAGPLRGDARVSLTRPADWGGQAAAANDKSESSHAWKIAAAGHLSLDSHRQMTLKADANIVGFQDLNFRVQALLGGITAIREARVEGTLKSDDFKGVASMKGGSDASELQTLDFVNCAVIANLETKTAGVRCGPQAVHLRLRGRTFINQPDLFTLAPEVDFKITDASFDKKKSADFSLAIILDHLGIFRFGTQLKGHIESSAAGGTKYSVKGRGDLIVPLFLQIDEMLRRTPYAIPAPFNTLDGAIGAQVNVDFTQDGGAIDYQAATRLDSDSQALHLDVNGKTTLAKSATGGLDPSTDVTLSILKLSLSAPRFDLRAPPAFKPDGRFVPLNEKAVQARLTEKIKPSANKFKLHVKTATPQAIRIATNLTKSSIPISMDVSYDDHALSKSPITGWVEVGQTPIELFKRSATVQSIRVDFLETGDNRLNGNIGINYGDYAMTILLLGEVADPQVRFISDPPLDDDQIVSVLLFGRPQHELGDEDKSSVANTKTAMADAVLGLGSLYLLASTPVESVGYDPDTGRVIARVGLGGGASVELGAGNQDSGSGVGFRKRLSKDFLFRSDVETLGSTGQRTVSALIEWVKRF